MYELNTQTRSFGDLVTKYVTIESAKEAGERLIRADNGDIDLVSIYDEKTGSTVEAVMWDDGSIGWE